MAVYTELFEILGDMTATEVIQVLCDQFGGGKTRVTFQTTGNRVEIRTFLGAVYMNNILASEVGPLEFWGGPPQSRDYYTGSLLTYLCDLILYQNALSGAYAELVTGYEYASQF